MKLTFSLAIAGVVFAAATAFAQQPPQTTIQLPTFSFFTVQTSVLVPDGGGAYLGGISRGQSGSVSRGLPFGKGPLLTNRGSGAAFQTGGMSVHATIIDNSEIDAAVLAAGMKSRGIDPAVSIEKLSAAQRAVEAVATRDSGDDLRGATSVADIRQSQRAEEDAKQVEAREIFLKAEAYAAKSQPGLAKIYYRMAANRATGELRNEVLSRLAALEPKHSSAANPSKDY